MPLEQVSFKVLPAIKRRLKTHAASRGETLTEVMTRYITEGITRDELNAMAAEVEPDPAALGKIQAKIKDSTGGNST